MRTVWVAALFGPGRLYGSGSVYCLYTTNHINISLLRSHSAAQGRQRATNNDTHTHARTRHTWQPLSCHLPYSAVAHKVNAHATLASLPTSPAQQQQSAIHMFSHWACMHVPMLGAISSTGSKHSKLNTSAVCQLPKKQRPNKP